MINKRYFLKNTASNYIVIIIRLALAFLTTPIYLTVYGKSLYGLFILSTSIVTSFNFLDFGGGKSLIKYTGEYVHDKDKTKFQSSLNTAISLNIISLIVILFLSVILLFNVSVFFKIPISEVNEAKYLFFIAIISTIFTFLDFIPSNILTGAGIFHERNKLQFFNIAYNTLLVAYVYFFKPSIVLFGWLNMVSFLSIYLIDVYLVKKKGLLKGVSIELILNKKLFRQSSFSYTNEIFLLSLVGFFSTQADKFILGSIIGVSSVAIYTVVTRPFFILKSFAGNIYTVLQPQIIKLHKSGAGELQKLVIRVSVIVFAIYLFVFTFFVITGQSFFKLWMHSSEYSEYFFWAVLAVFNWSLTGFYGFFHRTMFVTGDTRRILKINSFAALLNGFLSIVLTQWVGFQGVIIGTTVQTVINTFFFYKAGNKLYGIKLKNIFPRNMNLFIGLLILLLIISGYLTSWTYITSASLMIAESILLIIAFIIFLASENFLPSFTFLRTWGMTLNNKKDA